MTIQQKLARYLDQGVVGFPVALASSVGVVMASPVILTVTSGFGMAGSTLSNNLAVLTRAGLTTSTRDGRSIIYSANYRRMTDLLAFLMQDCCEGSPDVCAPLADVIAKAMCCQPQVG